MPDAPKFCQCGTPLEPGAQACGNCGKLVAAETSGGPLAIILCIFGGIALGFIAALPAIFVVALPTGGNSCNGNYLALAISAVIVLGIVAAFVYGLRVARRKPQIATLLMSGAIAFMLPFAPCSSSVLSNLQNCHH